MIPLTRKPSFDLTRHIAHRQHDICWFLPTEPDGFDICGHINRVIERSDIRRRFALLAGGK